VVIDQFQGAVDVKLAKGRKDEGSAILRCHRAGIDLDGVCRLCHGCSRN
jgi:hypothetical protein